MIRARLLVRIFDISRLKFHGPPFTIQFCFYDLKLKTYPKLFYTSAAAPKSDFMWCGKRSVKFMKQNFDFIFFLTWTSFSWHFHLNKRSKVNAKFCSSFHQSIFRIDTFPQKFILFSCLSELIWRKYVKGILNGVAQMLTLT